MRNGIGRPVGRRFDQVLVESSLMRYRIDELAARCRVTVDTIRFYQSRGLLPPPERSGRVAIYSDTHVERLNWIRDWKAKGLTLGAITRLVSGGFDKADEALVEALAEQGPDENERFLTLEELAEESGISLALLEAIEREGLMVARTLEGEPRFTAADAEALRAGLALLESGVPLSELLALAREHDAAMRRIAERAVDLFARFVRDPIRASDASEEEAADRLVEAFRKMLPAVVGLVTHHFRRLVLAAALERVEAEGIEAEIEAVHDESVRRLDAS